MRRCLIGVLLVSCVTWSRVGAAQGAPVRDDVVGGARAAQVMAGWLGGGWGPGPRGGGGGGGRGARGAVHGGRAARVAVACPLAGRVEHAPVNRVCQTGSCR